MPCDPNCEICDGFGYLRQDLPGGQPEFGQLTFCPNRSQLDLLGKRSGLYPEEVHWDWEKNVQAVGNNTNEAAQRVQKMIERRYGWVYLWGGYGQAKTLILKIASAVFLRENGVSAAYCRMGEIIDFTRSAMDSLNPSQENETRLGWYAEIPFLAIDEFERVRKTENAEERKFILMDQRYEGAVREKSLTLMAGNSAPRTFPGYLYDHIRDGRFEIIHLKGRSFRPGMDWDHS